MADLYRKSSLEKLSNPEQLDKMIKISSPMSWLALLAILLVIISTVTWSFVGTLPTTESINGILVRSDNTCAVFSDVSGTIVSYSKKSGDLIEKNEEIAKVRTIDGQVKSVVAPYSGRLVIISSNEESFITSGTEVARYTPVLDQTHVVVFYVPLVSAQKFKEGMTVSLYPTYIDSQKYGHMEGKIIKVDDYATNIASLAYVLGTGNQIAEQFAASGPIISVVCELKSDSSTKSGFYWSNEKGASLTVDNGTIISGKIVVDECTPITKLINNLKDK